MTLCAALESWAPPDGRLATWSLMEPALSDLDFGGLIAELHDRSTANERKNALLAALIRTASGGDEQAVTAVVVCLLPGVKTLARRLVGSAEQAELWSELVMQLVAHVRRYDLHRRPQRIAANLLLDTLSHTLPFVRRERGWQSIRRCLNDVDLSASPAYESEPCPVGSAVTDGALSTADGALILATRLGGFELAEMARLLGLSYEAVKKRRQRAEALLLGGRRRARHGCPRRTSDPTRRRGPRPTALSDARVG